MTRAPGAARAKATWETLPRKVRDDALLLIQIEQSMWSTRRGTNWHRSAVPTARQRHRALGLAIKALRRLANAR